MTILIRYVGVRTMGYRRWSNVAVSDKTRHKIVENVFIQTRWLCWLNQKSVYPSEFINIFRRFPLPTTHVRVTYDCVYKRRRRQRRTTQLKQRRPHYYNADQRRGNQTSCSVSVLMSSSLHTSTGRRLAG